MARATGSTLEECLESNYTQQNMASETKLYATSEIHAKIN